jgi:HNH endonuclease
MHEKLVFRHVYQEMFEPLQKGELVRHLCDNKLCINPEHLRKGTQMENVQDAIKNGRIRRGSQRPEALYDELQIYGVKVLMKNTDLTNSEIEYITKVSKCTIEGVRSGKQWKHVVV